MGIKADPRISVTHIGLYAALLQYWSEQGYQNPLHVFSYEIMKIAKIPTKTTCHKFVKDLSSFGYIRYEPSYRRDKGSKIYFKTTE